MGKTERRKALLDRLEGLAEQELTNILPGLIRAAVIGLKSLPADDETSMIYTAMQWQTDFIDQLQGLGYFGTVAENREDSNKAARDHLMKSVKEALKAQITNDRLAADQVFAGMWSQSFALSTAETQLNGYTGSHIALLHRFATQGMQ